MAKILWFTLATLHLGFVALGVCGFSPNQIFSSRSLSAIADMYALTSGTRTTHRYFAPGVASQLRLNYQVIGEEGIIAEGNIDQSNQEVSLRLGNLIDAFFAGGAVDASHEKKIKRALAASYAAKVFSTYPKASKVRVKIDSFVLPNMKQFRSGQKSFWDIHYDGVFSRNG